MASKTILLDVGGTFIKCSDGRKIPMPSAGSADDIAAALREAIGDTGGVKGIGVAIPGPFDYGQGTFLMRHKFASVYGRSFAELAGLPDSIPVKYLHDVNAPLIGAIQMLGLRDNNTALVTLGTGLGFSVALKGRVQYAGNGSPAVSLWDRPYGEGILEDIASARGIKAAYARLGGDSSLSARDIALRACDGEQHALETYLDMGSRLGKVLQEVAGEHQLDTVLFGGQISKSLQLFEEPLHEALGSVRIERAPEGAVFEGLSSLFSNNQ